MAAWSRLRTSFSFLSLPTTSPSSSASSSSASLPPPPLLDLADELWFYSSVVPLPSLSLPCLPSFHSSSPDPSTLIAQCMFSTSSALCPLSSSSFSSPIPPTDLQSPCHISPFLPVFDAYSPPPDTYDEDAYREFNGTANGGYSSSSDDDDAFWGRSHDSAGEDEEAYHYYTATSDWDDEDAYHGFHAPSDCEDEQQVRVTKEEGLPSDKPAHFEPDDALSGIYDVGVLLKDQHKKRTQEVPYSRFQREAASIVSALPPLQGQSREEQGDVKENLKLWAHTVASTLAWKAAAQARSLL